MTLKIQNSLQYKIIGSLKTRKKHIKKIKTTQYIICIGENTLTQFHRSQSKLFLPLTSFFFHETQRAVSPKIRSANGRNIGRTIKYTRASGKSIRPDLASGVEVAFDVLTDVVVVVNCIFHGIARLEHFL